VVNNGTVNVRNDDTLTFSGAVSGPGNFSDPGTVVFLDRFSPGSSTAEISFDGDVVFGSAATLQIELADPAGGHANDRLDVVSDVYLDGMLSVQAISKLGTVGDLTRTIITSAGSGGVLGTFAHVPTAYVVVPNEGDYLGCGVWFGNAGGTGVTYIGAPGQVTAVDLAIFQAKAGDTDGDRDVDFADFGTLANNYTGTQDPGTGGKDWREGDFDVDQDVDFGDFGQLAKNYTGTDVEYAPDGKGGPHPNPLPVGEGKNPPEIELLVYLVDAQQTPAGVPVTAGSVMMVGQAGDLSGYSVVSEMGSLLPDEGNSAPLMFYLANSSTEITAGNLGTPYAFEGALLFDWKFDIAGLEKGEGDLGFEYGVLGKGAVGAAVTYVVPEPSTLVLLACGLFGLLVLAIRPNWWLAAR
jgi:hypothetical protein